MNIREGRPSSYVGSREVRAPTVINDRFLQQVFSAHMPGGRTSRGSNSGPMPRSITGIIGYIINMVFQYCYSTISSILGAFFGGNEERSKNSCTILIIVNLYLFLYSSCHRSLG